MDKLKWKGFAISLLIILIMSWGIVGVLLYVGVQEIQKEEHCAYNICEGEDSYQYYDNFCYCDSVDANGELKLVKTEYLG